MNAVGTLAQLGENLTCSLASTAVKDKSSVVFEARRGAFGVEEEEEEEDKSQLGSSCSKTSEIQAMMHILKANIAVGVLAMPNAFKQVGLWFGLLLVPLIGGTCIHCMHILIQSHNHLCDKFNYEALDYDQVAALGLACGPKPARRLAKRAHVLVLTLLMLTQLGFCCVYILFVAESIQIAMLSLFQLTYPTTTYMLLIFPVIWLTSCTSNLKHLARISTLANLLQLSGLALILYDLCGPPPPPSSSGSQPASSVQVDLLAGLPLFFSTAVYAFEGIGVVLPVVKEMREPERLSGPTGVLNTSMSLVAILYMAVGFFGYAKYGQLVQGSITFNLPETALFDSVRLMFASAIGLSYSLQFYVPWTIMWPFIDERLFYSYRPRGQRDKLDILNKLSADNEWTLISGTGSEQDQRQVDDSSSAGAPDCSSLATTLATSYTMSTYTQQARAPASSEATNLLAGADTSQYGSAADQHQQAAIDRWSQLNIVGGQKRRNRFADVMRAERARDHDDHGHRGDHGDHGDHDDHDDDDDQQLPDVEWRPPPKSMRGLRKLVRYTVIFLTVSFTFVLAALIPQLDLFISLIGALASSSLAIVFPALIQTCTFWNWPRAGDQLDPEHAHAGRRHLFLLKNLLLVLFGCAGMLTGSWVSLAQLMAAYAPEMS